MDRDKILKLSIAVRINRHFSLSDIIALLTSYCLENKKDPEKTKLFIRFLLGINEAQRYFIFALGMYEKKFNIIILRDKNDNIIQIF